MIRRSARPPRCARSCDLTDKVRKTESRIDEVVDGLIDPNARTTSIPRKPSRPRRRSADRGGRGRGEDDDGAAQTASLLALRTAGLEKFARIPPPLRQMAKALENKARRTRTTCARATRSPTS